MQKYKDFQPTAFDSKANFMAWDSDGIEDIQEFFIVLGRNRDSDLLTESNWDAALKILGGESNTLQIHRFGHWACGWYELMLIHPSREAEGQAIENDLESYPVLDEDDFSEREFNQACEIWESGDLADRIHWIKTCGYGRKSIFAARRPELPSFIDTGSLCQ